MREMLPKPDPSVPASASVALPPEEYPGGMRVSDRVLAAFNHACRLRDLEAATDLLGVMERILERRVRRFGGDRRREVFTLNHAREHLEWLLARERERAEAIGR